MATTNKQDRQGARTPADLEQRYRFGESFAEAMGLAKDAQVVATAAKEATDKLDNSLNSDEIFNRLTENGALQGLYKEDGELYINASYLKTGVIQSEDGSITFVNCPFRTSHSKTYYASDYTEADRERAQQIAVGAITPTDNDLERLDIYGDGEVGLSDVVLIRNMLNGMYEWIKITWYVEIEPASKRNVMRMYYTIEDSTNGLWKTTETFNVGAGGVSNITIPTPDSNQGMLAYDYLGRVYCTNMFPIEMDTLTQCMYRTLGDGTKEWINPPMEVGVEYRTIERWSNQPVYKKLVAFTNSGALSGTASVNIPHGISNLSFVLSATTTTSGYLLPYVSSTTSLAISAWNATNLVAYNGSSSWDAGRTWYIEMRYTKST